MAFAGKWMEVETISLREISHSDGLVLYVFSHMWNLERKKENKVGGVLPKNQKEIIRGKGPRVGVREGVGKCWGVILTQLYCYIVHMYKYLTTNPRIK